MHAKAMLVGAAMAAAASLASPAGWAGAKDYRFELVEQRVKAGDGQTFAVRLVHVPSGKPVPDAVIFQTRLDMSPENMATMTAPLTPQPSDQPGIYRFRADFAMAGGWAFSLAAKVQGESETVQGRLTITATK